MTRNAWLAAARYRGGPQWTGETAPAPRPDATCAQARRPIRDRRPPWPGTPAGGDRLHDPPAIDTAAYSGPAAISSSTTAPLPRAVKATSPSARNVNATSGQRRIRPSVSRLRYSESKIMRSPARTGAKTGSHVRPRRLWAAPQPFVRPARQASTVPSPALDDRSCLRDEALASRRARCDRRNAPGLAAVHWWRGRDKHAGSYGCGSRDRYPSQRGSPWMRTTPQRRFLLCRPRSAYLSRGYGHRALADP
jgi:hypothetical protein